MRKSIKISIAIFGLVATLGILFGNKFKQKVSPCEIIDGQMASGLLDYTFFRVYRESKGSYPEDMKSMIDFVKDKESGYEKHLIELFEVQIKDPYTKSNYVYSPLKVGGKIVDYVLYSLGPDKKDNNFQQLESLNAGRTGKILFKAFVFDCKEFPLNKSKNKADIIVRVPGVTYGKEFEIEFIDP